MQLSKRVKRLKDNLIKDLPFFPNNRETLEELRSQAINDVFLHYLHWRTRHVPARVRSVQIAPSVTSDRRWKDLKGNINSFLDKVRNGEDLSPYLSKRAHKNGYTPKPLIVDSNAELWEDKDQILNTKGFHHFHLDMDLEVSGLSRRTDEVLFAHITRNSFRAVGIFNHSVFEFANDIGSLNNERDRMLSIYEKHVTCGMEEGTAYFSNIISTSGHPFYLIRLANHYSNIVKNIDPKLEQRNFVDDIYGQSGLPIPKKFNLDWHLNGLDIGIIDKKNNVLFNLFEGPI